MTPSTNKTKARPSDSSIGSYAIIEASGTQFWIEENRYYYFDRIDGNVDDKISIEKILLINDSKGLSIGKPYVQNAHVELRIMAHTRGKKVIVYKMRPKKKTRKKSGHRQELTRVMVTSISNGEKAKKVSKESKGSKTKSDAKTLKTDAKAKAETAVKDVKEAVKEVKKAVKEVKATSSSKAKKTTVTKKDSKVEKASD